MDSYLADLSFDFIKKFDSYLPKLLHNRSRLRKIDFRKKTKEDFC